MARLGKPNVPEWIGEIEVIRVLGERGYTLLDLADAAEQGDVRARTIREDFRRQVWTRGELVTAFLGY